MNEEVTNCNLNYLDEEVILEQLKQINDIVLRLYDKYEANFDMISYGSFYIKIACNNNGYPIYHMEHLFNKLTINDEDIPIKIDLKAYDEVDENLKNEFKVLDGKIIARYLVDGYGDWQTWDFCDKIPIQLDPYEMFKWVFKIVAWACYNMDDISGYENSDKYIRYKYIKYEVKFYDFK